LSVGKVAFAGKDLFTNEAIFSILPNARYELRFFFYSLPNQILRNANENIYGAKILNQKLIKSAKILVPPLPEQKAIVAHIETETQKIDTRLALIAKELSLVEEYKNALIAEAVTGKIDLRNWQPA
jgi:type I restriction enzyme S subunit